MSDLNSINKYKCSNCSKEIDFIWASSIYNNKLRKFERRELTYVENKNKVQESIL